MNLIVIFIIFPVAYILFGALMYLFMEESRKHKPNFFNKTPRRAVISSCLWLFVVIGCIVYTFFVVLWDIFSGLFKNLFRKEW